ncbi:jg5762 [Pararge aegeria aegeria]|uniref:Phospholipid-transporting ATPase n=1 Tax=Pararge aegeria aegeria TaxID=348720 RepID=A0A8S4SMT0_9NEOP|nr:jg5762 [Pararge aegeria aegeria]
METTPLLIRPKRKSIWSRFRRRELCSRVIHLGQLPEEEFPPNHVCNQKYNIITFLPIVLFEQFRFFLNLYFLVMALSQFIPSIRIGYLYTYWGPLCFVLAVTLFREAIDDFRRYRRDKEVNRQRYERISLDAPIEGYRPFITEQVPASELRVGDIVMLHKGQRVPADMILLRTNETMGTVFIRTDQLDGEIDWKLRIPLPSTQKLPTDAHLLDINAKLFVEKPEKDIHSFIGTCTRLDEEESDSLDIENTLWSGCVVASGQSRSCLRSFAQASEAVLASALCHNVTPVYVVVDQGADESQSDMGSSVMSESCGGAVPQQQLCDYQASSPDEVALVKWTDMMGVSLYNRDLHNISLKLRAANEIMQFNILQIFPFTSESKMMGIIVQEENTQAITYYVKGADVALSKLLNSSWLSTECKLLAADGLRTLVVAKKTMSKNEYLEFESEYKEARMSVTGRTERTAACIARLQRGLTLLALTGVEDRLADNVPDTLGLLRSAGIKIWMLTGDKLETALCIARSLQLGGGERWHTAPECRKRRDAYALLNELANNSDSIDLIIEGETLEVCLRSYLEEFVEVLRNCSGVVVARCSPTQKARVARLLRARGLVVAAVGDGGNDVAMIQEADMGVGIEGAEGRAASLAGDVSIREFSCLARLLLLHGRRSLMRSAALCLFIVHRGLIVSTMQAVFSVVFYFSSVSLYPGFLMVGYGTLFTMLPVFSLVLDKDLPSSTVIRNPQLYKQMTKGMQLSYKTFYIWTGISIYQGGVIMYGALVLFEEQLIHIVEISYTALILTELIMVALTVVTWHRLMALAELVSLLMYTATLLIFTTYFDADFIRHWDFWWKVTAITLVSCFPLYIVKFMHRKWSNRQYKNIKTK